jgi:hypothetical protein
MLLADRDPSFREAARRNLELMMACTHGGVLYGGPDYQAHGYPACIHHTFTHAKSLATVLDRVRFEALGIAERGSLPRDGAYGLKTFAEIGTRLAAIGPWRATVTEYDWEYAEHVQAGSGGGGGHVTGGAMSLLFHRALGPVLTASMSAYQMIEIANQQAYRDDTHMELTPRIECVSGRSYGGRARGHNRLQRAGPHAHTRTARAQIRRSCLSPGLHVERRKRRVHRVRNGCGAGSAALSSSPRRARHRPCGPTRPADSPHYQAGGLADFPHLRARGLRARSRGAHI